MAVHEKKAPSLPPVGKRLPAGGAKECRQILLTGLVVILFSELYFSFALKTFRISLAVAVFPVLLVTLARESNPFITGLCTSALVGAFRFGLSLLQGMSPAEAFAENIYGAMFYTWYGLFFMLLVKKKSVVPTVRLMAVVLFCDFGANLVEVGFETGLRYDTQEYTFYILLLLVACFRTLCAGTLLALYWSYFSLLSQAGHEERYQKLFMMKTGLKTEIYFMHRSSEQIEGIVRNAYRLYEDLSGMEVPPETQKLALQIACDVHDIKKDYIRITQGIESQIGESAEEGAMSFSSLLRILRESTYRLKDVDEERIRLDFRCRQDFTTHHHYALMSVLYNLVTNSVEAIQSAGGRGEVRIEEEKQGDKYLITVIDNGPGIPPELMRSVFKMGFSTKYNEKTGNMSRGMGLPGVKLSVEEQLGGSLLVSSEPGRQTAFYLEIPAGKLESET
ncbi:MAG: ATP-binding protein [Bacteroidales bacterium]|nr:ATP-binding protein [Fournierella massiliensis]MCF2556891.1 ATP-binding protein [Fournierella massiliensis]MCI6740918.1 ATP-binding protein [Bacteroidales bacterium]